MVLKFKELALWCRLDGDQTAAAALDLVEKHLAEGRMLACLAKLQLSDDQLTVITGLMAENVDLRDQVTRLQRQVNQTAADKRPNYLY